MLEVHADIPMPVFLTAAPHNENNAHAANKDRGVAFGKGLHLGAIPGNSLMGKQRKGDSKSLFSALGLDVQLSSLIAMQLATAASAEQGLHEEQSECQPEPQMSDNVSEPSSADTQTGGMAEEVGSNSDTTATLGAAGQSTIDELPDAFGTKSRRKRRKHKSLIDLAVREQKNQQKQADEEVKAAMSAQAAHKNFKFQEAKVQQQPKQLSVEEKRQMLKQSFAVAGQQQTSQAAAQPRRTPLRTLQAAAPVASKFCPYCRGTVLARTSFCMFCGGNVKGLWQL
jgi:hypothetical protein